MTINNDILKWITLGIIGSVIGFGIAGCGGGGGGGDGDESGGGGYVYVSDGVMTEISEWVIEEWNIEDIEATIEADPNQGSSGTPCTIIISFTEGGEVVEEIETYQCIEGGTFRATPDLNPEKEGPNVWKLSGILSGVAGVVRYYGLAADGSPTAQGEIDLNGGAVVPNYDEDGIYDDVWHFTETTGWGVLPTGWEEDDSSVSDYGVADFEGKSCLQITTEKDTSDCVRVRTESSDYGAGRYQWRVYVPSINKDFASSAIRAFLCSSDNNDREIGFEIVYDTMDEKPMCYMTVNDGSGMDWPDPIALVSESWYTLQIVLTPNNEDKYVVSWKLKKEGESEFQEAPEDYTCEYGPSDTSFHIECSVETVEGGQHQQDIEAYFDYVFSCDTMKVVLGVW